MKKFAISIVIILMLALTACGATSSGTPQTAAAQQGGSLPIQEQVLIGTFKLEGTPQAVTAQQAAKLIPLWQVYKDLSGSDTAAQEEVDGLVQQIQDTMTPEQMQAVKAMNLTRQDIFAVMQEQGINFGGQGGQNISPEQIATLQAGRGSGNGFRPPDGGFQGGGFPRGGPDGGGGGGGGFPGGGPGGQNFTPQQQATAQARRANGGSGGGFNRVPTALIDAMVHFLQQKAGS
jgi:hypothetical protein